MRSREQNASYPLPRKSRPPSTITAGFPAISANSPALLQNRHAGRPALHAKGFIFIFDYRQQQTIDRIGQKLSAALEGLPMNKRDLRSAILGYPVRRAVDFMLSRGVSSRRSGSFGILGLNFGIEAEFKIRSLNAFLRESRSAEDAAPGRRRTLSGRGRILAEHNEEKR